MNPFPSPSRTMGTAPAPAATPWSSDLPLSYAGCRPRLPAPRIPNMVYTPSPRSCGSLFVVSPSQISPSVRKTPTESTPGLWMPPYRHRYRIIPPSPSAVDFLPLSAVGRRLGPRSYSPPSAPCLLCHRHYLPPPVPPPGITSSKPLRPPPH